MAVLNVVTVFTAVTGSMHNNGFSARQGFFRHYEISDYT